MGAKKKQPDEDGEKPARHKRRGPIARFLRAVFVLAVLAVFVGAGVAVGGYYYFTQDLPAIDNVRQYQPREVLRVLDRNGNVIGEVGAEKRTVIEYAQIPDILIKAAIAAEDATFFENRGLDLKGMLRALFENVIRGRTVQGGSTITQQVIKRLLLTPERKIKRKVQEIVLAYRLTQMLSKEEILSIYLNDIYYGHGRYGCEEASRFFFGKPVGEVSVGEAALLAGVPKNPSNLSPLTHPEAAKTRQRYVLGRMAELKFIDPTVAESEAREPIEIVRTDVVSQAPEALMMVQAEGVEAGEGTVKTTIDADLQGLARSAVEKGLEAVDARQGYREPIAILKGAARESKLKEISAARAGTPPKDGQIVSAIVTEVVADPHNPQGGSLIVDMGGMSGSIDLAKETRYRPGKKPMTQRFPPGSLVRVRVTGASGAADKAIPVVLELGPQAAMVVLDVATGDILALVGGYGFRAGWFDRSRHARRQPGSAFKPFVYSAAIESKRFTAATIMNDAPEVYDLWKPSNYEKNFRGPVRLRDAFAHSINTVAIKLLSEIGIPSLQQLVVRTGIDVPVNEEMGLSLALGSLTITPLELAQGYLPFFNGGYRVRSRVTMQIGEREQPASVRVEAMSSELAYVMVSLMESVVTDGTGRGVAARMRRPVAGKTGTSNDQHDAWFVGATPDILAAVWVGFDDMQRLGRGETGGGTALPIWLDFMTRATEGTNVRDFAMPATIRTQRIDPASGLLPAPGQEGIEELFLAGTEPTTIALPGSGGADVLLFRQ